MDTSRAVQESQEYKELKEKRLREYKEKAQDLYTLYLRDGNKFLLSPCTIDEAQEFMKANTLTNSDVFMCTLV